jgi:hypothetical protein
LQGIDISGSKGRGQQLSGDLPEVIKELIDNGVEVVYKKSPLKKRTHENI